MSALVPGSLDARELVRVLASRLEAAERAARSPGDGLCEEELHWLADFAEVEAELAVEALALDAEAEAMSGKFRLLSDVEMQQLADEGAAIYEAELQPSRRPAPAKKSHKVRSQPQREAARRVLDSLYGDNIPGQVTLPNKLLCRDAQEHARSFSFPFTISDDTFLRAAGRKSAGGTSGLPYLP